MNKPNVLFIFPDQMRAQATGYAGDPNVLTPNLDAMASQSINCCNAVSGMPLCTPARGSLVTGQYPHTNGVFLNGVRMRPQTTTMGEAFAAGGYDTGWIGKWHLQGNGHGHSAYVPPQEHFGFDYWHVSDTNHQYWDSSYYDDQPHPKQWPGYSAQAQTEDVKKYLWDQAKGENPFLMVLSLGPPHTPYDNAPQKYQQMYDPQKIQLRPNVPAQSEEEARQTLAGYYAHISALDDCMGQILQTLEETNLAENTIVVFWSDHGDMMGSQSLWEKNCPFDESIRVPLLWRSPAKFGSQPKTLDAPINAPIFCRHYSIYASCLFPMAFKERASLVI